MSVLGNFIMGYQKNKRASQEWDQQQQDRKNKQLVSQYVSDLSAAKDPNTIKALNLRLDDEISDPTARLQARQLGEQYRNKKQLEAFMVDPFVQDLAGKRSGSTTYTYDDGRPTKSYVHKNPDGSVRDELPNKSEFMNDLAAYQQDETSGLSADLPQQVADKMSGFLDDPTARKTFDMGDATGVLGNDGLKVIDDVATPTNVEETWTLKDTEDGWQYFSSNPETPPVPTGKKKKAEARGMSVTLPDGTVISESGGETPTGTRSTWMKDYVENQQRIDSLGMIGDLYNPDFLTYSGKGRGAAASFLNKLDPDIRSEFRANQAKFISLADKEFLTFRKWATGVAGGEKEMQQIRDITFSSEDGPQDFESKMEVAKNLYQKLNVRLKAALSAGIDNEQAFKAYAKALPLDNIPTLQERGDELHLNGLSEAEVLAKLQVEGYL